MAKRNYRQEYDRYQGRPEQIAARSRRNQARRKVVAAKGAAAVKGKDVAHRDNNTRNNSAANLDVQPKSKNRSFPRTKTARRKKG